MPGLILSERPLRALAMGERARPGIAVVFATRDGRVEAPSSRWNRLPYVYRYEVDTSDHIEKLDVELPSVDGRVFHAHLDFSWRVSDPCQVVLRQIRHGLPVIIASLETRLRGISRQFSVEQWPDVEDRFNWLLADGPARFAEGLVVFRLNVNLSPASQDARPALPPAPERPALPSASGEGELNGKPRKTAARP